MAKTKILIDLKRVKSSNIRAIGYDAGKLYIVFNTWENGEQADGNLYMYEPVSNAGYISLLSAESIGGYFAKNIRPNPMVNTHKLDKDKYELNIQD